MKIGIICPSEIAYRRFLPALSKVEGLEFAGVGVNTPEERYGDKLPDKESVCSMLKRGYEKANRMVEEYGGDIFSSFQDLISARDIDAVYLPLPPALHYEWALKAIEYGKHVLLEKPATTKMLETKYLINKASNMSLAIHENYMFIFHDQMKAVKDIIDSGEIGEVRLYRINFGFPRRSINDFRYNKLLGGGALLDAGGYTLKCSSFFLNDSIKVDCANLCFLDDFEVDIYGSGTLVDSNGVTSQVAFGMDNEYRCELEVWGSKGILTTGRILTAPVGYVPNAKIKKGQEEYIVNLPEDDSFLKSITHFISCINDKDVRENNYKSILKQAELVDQFQNMVRQ